jgi:ADP-heptose:LPS heptosyltransferase
MDNALAGAKIVSLPLPLLAALLESCALFVGNDSGVSHLAAAVGTPVICLFGPSDHAIWAPRGKHVCVISGENNDVRCIFVESVYSAAMNLLPVAKRLNADSFRKES